MSADAGEHRHRRRTDLWKRDGILDTTPGKSIDRQYGIAELCDLYDVQCMHADRWRLDEVTRLLDADRIKLKVEPHGMGWKDYAPSLDAFESAVLTKQLRDNSPLLNMAMANARVLTDPAGGRKLAKNKSYGRIDPLVPSWP